MAEFIAVGPADLGVGEGKIVSAGNVELAVFNVDGAYFAVENTCPHRGGPLGEGDLKGSVVTCPWHGFQFDVKTGENARAPQLKVRTFPTKVEGGKVWVEA